MEELTLLPAVTPSAETAPATSPPPTPEPQTLVVGHRGVKAQANPFVSETEFERDVINITQAGLLCFDRGGNLILNGIEGQTRRVGTASYTCLGAADIKVSERANGTADYNIRIRDDMFFSDGQPVTIDDLIFTMYVLSDPGSGGGSAFYSLPVTGMEGYRLGIDPVLFEKYALLADEILKAGVDNGDFEHWTEDMHKLFWDKLLSPLAEEFIKEIITLCEGYFGDEQSNSYYGSDVALGMYGWGFGEADEDGLFVAYVTGTEYDLAAGEFPDISDFWDEMLADYGSDISMINETESAGMDLVEELKTAFIFEAGRIDPAYTGEIMNIDGIRRTGDYSVAVITDTFDAEDIYLLDIPIAPLHYYGDTGLYDYQNNRFGFIKGEPALLQEKTVPMGAGAYMFVSYAGNTACFEANPMYYAGEPPVRYLEITETSVSGKSYDIIAYPGWIRDILYSSAAGGDIAR